MAKNMSDNRNEVKADVDLAESLKRRDDHSHDSFRRGFSSILRRRYLEFTQRVSACRRGNESLTPHVSFAVARSYLQLTANSPTSLEAYLEGLRVCDLYHAAACLPWDAYAVPEPDVDPVAVLALSEIVRKKVYPTLRKRYGGDQCVDDAIDELLGHVMLPGQDGDIRLAQYSGRSRLETWLTTVGIRMVVSCLSGKRAEGEDDSEGGERAPTESNGMPPTAKEAREFVRQFYPCVVELVNGVSDPVRLQKLADCSEMSDREKQQYRQGLTDRQKIVFQLLYYRGLSPAETARVLDVTRPYVSQCIKLYRDRLCLLAAAVIEELAETAGVSLDVIIDGLDRLLQFFRQREWDSEWEDLSMDNDALQAFLDDLRKQRIGSESDRMNEKTDNEDSNDR